MCSRGALEQAVRPELLAACGAARDQLEEDGVPKEWSDLAAVVAAHDVVMEGPRARYNVAPTDWIPTLVDVKGRTLVDTRWGVRMRAGSQPSHNARIEQVVEGTAWAALAVEGRAVHVLSGFYEWRQGVTKDPVYVTRRDGQPLFLAALMEEGPEGQTTATVTAPATEAFAPVAGRMPVVLDDAVVDRWLKGTLHADALTEVQLPMEELEIRPVQTLVNNVRNDGPALVLPRPTLF